MAKTTTYAQFVAFGTDLVGLERLLRLFQAACSVLISYPLLLAALVPKPTSEAQLAVKAVGLGALRGQLNVSRRFIRLFRFMDTLNAGFDAYVAPEKNLEVWLDVVSKTCLGMFGMIETLTLVDLIGIPGLEVFGPARSSEIDAQSQYFWFFGLATSVTISLIKLSKVNVPPIAEKEQEKPTKTVSEKADEKEDTKEKAAKDAEEKKRLKEVAAKKKVLLRSIVSDVVDMLLPGSAIGFVKISGASVSSAMFFTTLTTGWAAWDRIGARLQ
ncbi:peroxisomal biogenesis factor 11 [Thelonectria olida]|uniref:Peroxisomal biogenesis factor 11 n=1 Tax=Thelonectria olida TaxID=1576542 RepID=A0A9P8W1W4_9HYPO|nr:peroxisomal biogenesis factor 11 [Thelonectria olida]